MSTYLLLQSELDNASVNMIKAILSKIPALGEITEEGGERENVKSLLEGFLVSHFANEELVLTLLDKGVLINADIVQKILTRERAQLGVITPYIPLTLLSNDSNIPNFAYISTVNDAFLGKSDGYPLGQNTSRWQSLNYFGECKVSVDLFRTQLAESVHSLNQFELEYLFGSIIQKYAKYPNLLKSYPLKEMLLSFGEKEASRPRVDKFHFNSKKPSFSNTPTFEMIQVLFNQGESFFPFAESLLLDVLLSIPHGKGAPFASELLSAIYHSALKNPSLCRVLGNIYVSLSQRRTWVFSLSPIDSELQAFLLLDYQGNTDMINRFLVASLNGRDIKLFENAFEILIKYSLIRPDDDLLQSLLNQAAAKGNIPFLEGLLRLLVSKSLIEQVHVIQAWTKAVSAGKNRAAKRLLEEVDFDSESVPRMLNSLIDDIQVYPKRLRLMIENILKESGYRAVDFTDVASYRANLALSILKGPLPNQHYTAESLRIALARKKFKNEYQALLNKSEDARSFYQAYVMPICEHMPSNTGFASLLSLIKKELTEELVERIHTDLLEGVPEEESQAVLVGCFMDAIQNEEALNVLYLNYYLAADLDDGLDVFIRYVQKIALSESFTSLLADLNTNEANAIALLYDASFYQEVIKKQMDLMSTETITYLDALFERTIKRCATARDCAILYDAITLTESKLSDAEDVELFAVRQRYMDAFLGNDAKMAILDKFPLLQASPFLKDLSILYIDYKLSDLSYASFDHYLKLTYIELDREEAVHPYLIHSTETYLNRFDAAFAFEVAYENEVKHRLYNVINAALSKVSQLKSNFECSRLMIEIVDRLYLLTDANSMVRSGLKSNIHGYSIMSTPSEDLTKTVLSAIYHYGVDEALVAESLTSVGKDFPQSESTMNNLAHKASILVSELNKAFDTERKIISLEGFPIPFVGKGSDKSGLFSIISYFSGLLALTVYIDRKALNNDTDLESSEFYLRLPFIMAISAVILRLLEGGLKSLFGLKSNDHKEPKYLVAREVISDNEQALDMTVNQSRDEEHLRELVNDAVDGFIHTLAFQDVHKLGQPDECSSLDEFSEEDSLNRTRKLIPE